MQTTCLAPWFGSNRMLAPHVAGKLAGCEWVGVPFGGGLAELVHLKARTIVVSDLHRHIINLARVVRSDDYRSALTYELDNTPFHPDELSDAQQLCTAFESLDPERIERGGVFRWARAYFICSWMSRSGEAGTDGEFSGKIPVRWDASGGDSAVRFRSATESLAEWGVIMRRCTFLCLDVFDFLAKVKDEAKRKGRTKNGLYLDPPFPGPGEAYTHTFDENQHRKLAYKLSLFKHVRLVCRFYDHPLVHELYPEKAGWKWHPLAGRKSSNAKAPELLIVRN